MERELPRDVRCWTAEDRAFLVLSVLKDESSIQEAAAEYQLPASAIQRWKQDFLLASEESLLRAASGEVPPKELDATVAGVWVCSEWSRSVAPLLFLEVACPGREVRLVPSRWTGRTPPPMAGRDGDEVVVLRRECRSNDPDSASLALLTPSISVAPFFESQASMSDWQFEVDVQALLLLIGGHDVAGVRRHLRHLLGLPVNRGVTWAIMQQLPLVVAAMGYRVDDFPEEEFRRAYGLPSGALIIAGPAISNQRELAGAGTAAPGHVEGEMARLARLKPLGFDESYAERLLGMLEKAIARKRPNC